MKSEKESGVVYSLLVPLSADKSKFDNHVERICAALKNQAPETYEIVAIEGRGKESASNEWDIIKGEVLVIIDGNLDAEPTSLSDVIAAFNEGTDMAFASQYEKGKKEGDDPIISYLGVRRSSLSRLNESRQGYKLVLEILGPETIKKLSTDPSEVSGGYILKHLRKMIGSRT